MIRKATGQDIDRISEIYDRIHDEEENGRMHIGWIRGVYPTRKTALEALRSEDLFVSEEAGQIVAAAIINQNQVPEYVHCPWCFPAPDHKIMVLHTLVVDPRKAGCGYGTAFVRYYEQYALQHGCTVLRMDTNEKNVAARKLYAGLGYHEPGIVPCIFNGIPDVRLVCLEKRLSPEI